MKKILFAVCIIIILGIGVAVISKSTGETGVTRDSVPAAVPAATTAGSAEADAVAPEDVTKMKSRMQARDHSKSNSDCKTCHSCEYPTKRDACLVMCPRSATSIHHSPEEAPEVLVLDDLSKRYGNVVFSHKLHAQMSEMSIGCTGCHHYNTTGPVLSCKKCHEKARKRDNISAPDLEAAYHRQCMPCHRKWNIATDCNSCHLPKGAAGVKKQAEAIKRTTGRSHPALKKPTRVVYETAYTKGKFVTFNHGEHVGLFKQPCLNCHKDDSCTRCHDVKNVVANNLNQERHLKVHRSFEEHHKACSSCHENGKCTKCHQGKEMSSFNHTVSTGWDLGKFHSGLRCDKCHVVKKSFSPLDKNCSACHKNWKLGKFDHKATGLVLSANHKDFECTSCHLGNNFSSKPVCKECHNDKVYPGALPGKRNGKK